MTRPPEPTDRVLDAATDDLRLGRLLRATPGIVWLITVAYATLAGFYLLGVPPLHAPDEVAHVDLVLQESDHLGLDPYEGLTYSSAIEGVIPLPGLDQVDWRVTPSQPWGDGLSAAEVPPRGDRPTVADLDDGGATGAPNAARSHPPLYYMLVDGGNLALEQVMPDPSWDAVVGRLRLVSLLLGLPLPWLAFWTGVRLDRRRRTGVVAALAVCAVPQLAHSTGSVNNDVLLFPLTGLVVLACTWVATGDRSARPAIVAGVATGLGALTKVFALPAPLWVLTAYLVAWRRGAGTRHTVRRLALAAAVTVVAGGFWPLRAILVEGSAAPRGFGYPLTDVDPDPLWWVGEAVRRLTTTGWGKFGVEQFPLPAILVAVATAGLVLWLAVGLRRRPVGLVLLLPMVTTLAMIGYAAYDGYLQSGLPTGLHGRYLFTGAVGVAAVTATGLRAAAERLRWGAADLVVMVLAVVVLQGVGAFVVTTDYWAGPGVAASLHTMLVWAPVGRPVLAVVGGLLGLGVVGLLGALVREARRPVAVP